MIILYTHIIAASVAFVLGFPLFFSQSLAKNIQQQFYFWLKVTLVITAITGIFLNLNYFSAFHALAILTLVNVPLSIRALRKGDSAKHNQNLFENYLGLFLALVGTTFPLRFVGIRLYSDFLNIDYESAVNYFYISMALSAILSVILYILSKQNKLPFNQKIAPK